MKRFEVWLDESGAFFDNSSTDELYSFLGGVLIEGEKVVTIQWSKLLTEQVLNHAMEMTNRQKKAYVLPVLQQFKQESKSYFVYFENIEYKGVGDNRALYLEIFAEGVLQLLQFLEAKYGGVQLDMIVASRTTQGKGHIKEEEYQAVFDQLVKEKQKLNALTICPESQVKFQLHRATQSNKLIIADFASNIRRQYLRRAKGFCDENTMQILQELFLDARVFSTSELSSDKRIRILLSQQDISEALMEIFTSDTLSKKERTYYLEAVLERMQFLSYRLIKSQLKQLAAEVLAYTARQEEYKYMIQFLSLIQEELISKLKVSGHPYELFQFEVCLQLSDVYLRAGQFVEAGNLLTEGMELVQQTENSLENIITLYRIYEKFAVFYIDSFQFDRASKLMQEIGQVLKDILEILPLYTMVSPYFSELKSEYYGDVLCMDIYSRLFQVREEQFSDIRNLSDLGLSQYPNFPGELERHRQYRSRLEQKAGNFQEAIHWLILAIDFKHTFETAISTTVLKRFWDKVESQETSMSQEYYMMYYLLILTSAQEAGDSSASMLYNSFVNHTIAKRLILSPDKKESSLIEAEDIAYHPREVSYWYLGDYYRSIGNNVKCLNYYNAAISICNRNEKTLTLQLRMIGIQAAKASLLFAQKDKQARATLQKLYRNILKLKEKLEPATPSLTGTVELLTSWSNRIAPLLLEENSDLVALELWTFALDWRY